MYTGIYTGKRGKVKNSPVMSAAAGVAYANYISCMFATVHAMIPEPYTFVQAFRLPRLLSHRHATKKNSQVLTSAGFMKESSPNRQTVLNQKT